MNTLPDTANPPQNPLYTIYPQLQPDTLDHYRKMLRGIMLPGTGEPAETRTETEAGAGDTTPYFLRKNPETTAALPPRPDRQPPTGSQPRNHGEQPAAPLSLFTPPAKGYTYDPGRRQWIKEPLYTALEQARQKLAAEKAYPKKIVSDFEAFEKELDLELQQPDMQKARTDYQHLTAPRTPNALFLPPQLLKNINYDDLDSYQMLSTAHNITQKSRQLLDAVKNKSGIGKGITDHLFSREAITLGLEKFGEEFTVKRLMELADKNGFESLTPSQLKVLDAATYHALINMYQADNLPITYEIGSMVGEAIPSMLVYAGSRGILNPISKSFLKWLNYRFARSIAGKATTELLTASSMNLLSPEFYTRAITRSAGSPVPSADPDQPIHYASHTRGESMPTALTKSFLYGTGDNLIESSAIPLAKRGFGKMARRLSPKMARLLSASAQHLPEPLVKSISQTRTQALDFSRLIKNKNFLTGYTRFARQAGYNGLIGEPVENILSESLSALLLDDISFSDIFNWRHLYETTAASTIISAGMGILSGSMRAGTKLHLKQQLKQTRELISTSFSPEECAHIYQLSGESVEKQSEELVKRLYQLKKTDSPLQKRILTSQINALQQYFMANDRYHAFLAGEQAQLQQATEQESKKQQPEPKTPGLQLDGEEITDSGKNITPEQKSLLSRPNSRQYPSVQELYGDKDNEPAANRQVKKSESDHFTAEKTNQPDPVSSQPNAMPPGTLTPEQQLIIDRARQEGTWLKAPNGQPSNLTPQQWVEVRTPAFKEQFGDWEAAHLYNQAVRAWNNPTSTGKTVIQVEPKLQQALKELLGKDIQQVILTDGTIRHIKNRHSQNESSRGQVDMTPEDIAVLPYLLNHFDRIEFTPKHDDRMGNRAITLFKRINGEYVICNIEKGPKKVFVVTSWQLRRSDALDVASATPGPNVRNDSDYANVKRKVQQIKDDAVKLSKQIDENGEPRLEKMTRPHPAGPVSSQPNETRPGTLTPEQQHIDRDRQNGIAETSWELARRSDALDAASATPGLNVRNDSDYTNVKRKVQQIKDDAVKLAKQIDENGEPRLEEMTRLHPSGPVSSQPNEMPPGTLTPEQQLIIDRARQEGTWLKAPNGQPSNLTPQQWVEVRTPAFKEQFGDWEKTARIEKLKNSQPITVSGNEYVGKYELNNRSANNYILHNLRKTIYINKDTQDPIIISRKGANKIASHDTDNKTHLKSIAYIPQLLEQAIFITEQPNTKDKNGFQSYRYYIVGLHMGDTDYTVKLVIGRKNNQSYYDHALTEIEKSNLIESIDLLKSKFADKEITSFNLKDKRLLSILQTKFDKNLLDENGEPRLEEMTRPHPAGPVSSRPNETRPGTAPRPGNRTDIPQAEQLVKIDFNSIFDAVPGRNRRKTLPLQQRIEYARKIISQLDASHIEIYMTPRDLPAQIAARLDNGHTLLGFYDPRHDQAGIFLEYATSKEEIERVIMHEVVGHRGIRALIGPGAASFYHKVFEGMPPKAQEKYLARYGEWQVAADEYIADIAAGMYNQPVLKELWKDIKGTFRYFVRKANPDLKLTDSDIHLYLRSARQYALNRPVEHPNQRTYPTHIGEAKEALQEIFPQPENGGETQSGTKAADAPGQFGITNDDIRLWRKEGNTGLPVDGNGKPFVKTTDGSFNFGYITPDITEEAGLPAAPIRLSQGMQNEETNLGYGLEHMEAGHNSQISAQGSGFSSVIEFVQAVARNYDCIKEGKTRENGLKTYLLIMPKKKQKSDEKDKENTLYIELATDGNYWTVNSGGIFRKDYSKSKKTVWEKKKEEET